MASTEISALSRSAQPAKQQPMAATSLPTGAVPLHDQGDQICQSGAASPSTVGSPDSFRSTYESFAFRLWGAKSPPESVHGIDDETASVENDEITNRDHQQAKKALYNSIKIAQGTAPRHLLNWGDTPSKAAVRVLETFPKLNDHDKLDAWNETFELLTRYGLNTKTNDMQTVVCRLLAHSPNHSSEKTETNIKALLDIIRLTPNWHELFSSTGSYIRTLPHVRHQVEAFCNAGRHVSMYLEPGKIDALKRLNEEAAFLSNSQARGEVQSCMRILISDALPDCVKVRLPHRNSFASIG